MSLDLDDRQRAMLQEMGVHVWLPSAEPQQPEVPVARLAPPMPVQATRTPPAPTAAYPDAGTTAATSPPARGEALVLHGMDGPALRQSAATCQACGLCAGRKHSTLHLPDQPVQADWLVLGDPPDEDEDRLGQPFVEQTGVLLDNMLKAVGATRGGTGRAGAYVTNIVKCRPGMPRNPEPDELATCQAFLQHEIALVKPKLILATGRFAAQSLLHHRVPHVATVPLGKLRGQIHHFQGIPVVVSYHPTYLLRNQADKAKAWADLCLAMATLESSQRNDA